MTTSDRFELADPVDGGVGEDAVRRTRVHLGHPLALQGAGDLHQGARRVDLVVHDDGALAAHLADDVEQLRAVVVVRSPLLDDRERRIDQLGERPGALGEAQVRDHDRVVDVPSG